MRLKIFTGTSVAAAMAKVREELGDEAVIINVDEAGPNGVRVSAAYEPAAIAPAAPELPIEDAAPAALTGGDTPFTQAALDKLTRYHGLPGSIARRISDVANASGEYGLRAALAAGLENLVGFSGLPMRPARPIMLVGPPGAGKTLTAAKITAMACLRGDMPRVISTDLLRSAGVDQLELLCQKLDIMVSTAEDARELRYLLNQSQDSPVQIVDTTGVNAYAMEDAQRIARFAAQSKAEPILVMPAGMDALEAAEQAHVFATLGIKRLIVTRLDGARRLSGILTALAKGRLQLAGLSASPFLGDGLIDATPKNLAQMLIDKPGAERLNTGEAAQTAVPSMPAAALKDAEQTAQKPAAHRTIRPHELFKQKDILQ